MLPYTSIPPARNPISNHPLPFLQQRPLGWTFLWMCYAYCLPFLHGRKVKAGEAPVYPFISNSLPLVNRRKRTLLQNCDESLLVLDPVMFAATMALSLSIPGIQSGIQRKVSKMYSASLYTWDGVTLGNPNYTGLKCA